MPELVDALAPIVNAEQPDLIARNAKEPNMLPDTFRCKNDKLSLIHI